MSRVNLWVGLLITAVQSAAFGQVCHDYSQIVDMKALVRQIAVIDTDDRVVRDKSDVSLEAAQGRLHCLLHKLSEGIPTKKQMMSQKHYVSNATLAFAPELALVSRHMFFNKFGKQEVKMENCFFEHIVSGEIIAVTDWEWPPMPKDSADRGHQDYAVLRLRRAPTGGKPVPKDNIIIYRNTDVSRPITVVSNYADNLKNKESLTITTCHRKGFYRLRSNDISTLWDTDCDTGAGSSGAQVYVYQNGSQKLFGLISGGLNLNPDGGKFDPNRLATTITQFDESLFEAYERLKQRSSI